MLIQKPKGTLDILPEDAFQRNFVENFIKGIFENFNYKEIRTPTFEKTSLFKRSIGEGTDIVSKEMYSFNEDEFTLKPEMTAPVIRAYLENSLYNQSPLQKFFYISNMFRRERPQAGRYREFSQFGVEAIGSNDYSIDVEIIVLGIFILKQFGITNFVTKINSIGTSEEREIYINELKEFLKKHFNELSSDSQKRFDKNPLRILDTKDPKDKEILLEAPILYDYLNDNSKLLFEQILDLLTKLEIQYEVDYNLVRGLDYYSHTTFEIMSPELGAQSTIIGGGRYNLLVEQLGGKSTPAIGFAAGIERLLILINKSKFIFPEQPKIKLYIVNVDENSKSVTMKLLLFLRTNGIKCETDFLNRSIKAQMKEANKFNAEYVVVIGEDEIKSNKVKLKRMSDGNEIESEINNLINFLN